MFLSGPSRGQCPKRFGWFQIGTANRKKEGKFKKEIATLTSRTCYPSRLTESLEDPNISNMSILRRQHLLVSFLLQRLLFNHLGQEAQWRRLFSYFLVLMKVQGD